MKNSKAGQQRESNDIISCIKMSNRIDWRSGQRALRRIPYVNSKNDARDDLLELKSIKRKRSLAVGMKTMKLRRNTQKP